MQQLYKIHISVSYKVLLDYRHAHLFTRCQRQSKTNSGYRDCFPGYALTIYCVVLDRKSINQRLLYTIKQECYFKEKH